MKKYVENRPMENSSFKVYKINNIFLRFQINSFNLTFNIVKKDIREGRSI